METATADAFAPKQNGAANYCNIDDLRDDKYDNNHGGVISDDDFGPETNVDNIDETLISQPVSAKKSSFTNVYDKMNNGNPFDEADNRVIAAAAAAVNNDRSSVTVADAKKLENVSDKDKITSNVSSDESDDEEWNYVKGVGNNNNTSKSNNGGVDSSPSEPNVSSQDVDYPLNPDAAEFVPQSPTGVRKTNNVAGDSDNEEKEKDEDEDNDDDDEEKDDHRSKKIPAKLQSSCILSAKERDLLEHDEFVASSPLKGQEKSMENIDVPSANEFDNEIRKRPSNIMPNFELDSFQTSDAADRTAAPPSNDVSVFDISANNCPFDATTSTTNAVFGEDSCYANRLSEFNDVEETSFRETTEKQDVGNEKDGYNVADSTTTTTTMTGAVEFCVSDENTPSPAAKIFENGGHVFDNEDYPSIIEMAPSDGKLFNLSDDRATKSGTTPDIFGDSRIRGFGDDDPLDRVKQMTSLLCSDTSKCKLFDDDDMMKKYSINNEAAAAAAFDPFAVTATTAAAAVTNPFAVSLAESNEATCVKRESAVNLVECVAETKPTSTTEETQNTVTPDIVQIENTLSEQIVDAAANASQSVDDVGVAAGIDRLDDVTPTSEICEGGGDAPNEPCHQIDAQAPYVHDCTRLDEKSDSVHHHPAQQKHYADLTPSETTSESDKLESELRESNETKFEIHAPSAPRSPPPTPAETATVTKPAAAIIATATVAAAATTIATQATKETKKTSIIKKADDKTKSPTKTAAKPTTATTLTKTKVAPVGAAAPKTTAKPTTTTTAKAAPTSASSRLTSRPTSAAKPTTASSPIAAKTTKTSTSAATARPSTTAGRSTTTTTARPPPASPAKSKLTAAKPLSSPSKSLTNGDVSSSKPSTTSTVKRATSTTTNSGVAKKTTETATKAPVNLSTRTSLAPTTAKPRPATATTVDKTKPAMGSASSTVKRPASATSRLSSTNKDTKDITNKRLSTTTTTTAATTMMKNSQSKTSTNVKTESKVNNGVGVKIVPKKPTTTVAAAASSN